MRAVVFSLTAGVLLIVAGPSALSQKKDPYAEHIAPSGPKSPQEQKKLFRLPPGFEIQLVAAEPDIKKPININFDAKGRLWVTHSIEYPFAAKPGQPTRDSVKILDDFAPDGRARKITTFADNLNIPIGVLPLGNGDGAMVYTIPHIVRLRDTKGTGTADSRDVLYSGYGYRDTHGMTGEFQWGFDGWVYACHGYSNTSKVEATTKERIEMQSGNTYRIKPDGSRIEYFTHGQVNPFGLTFDPLGNIYSCDCHSQPVYQLLKGAWYPSFGKPHDGLGFGPEMLTNYKGSTAIAGIAYYAANHFPPAYHDKIFFGDVVTNQIMQVTFKLHGSTPKAAEPLEFLGCGDPWFRPVDIKLGPDGALYVADFYTRIIGHYEVPLSHPLRDREHGRIWRIVYKGKDGKNTLQALRDFTKMSAADLVKNLGDVNLTVRMTAANQLAERGGKDVIEQLTEVLRGSDLPYQKAHALWILARLDALHVATLAREASAESLVNRVHAFRVMAERKVLEPRLRELALRALKKSDAMEQRSAGAALGAHPEVDNIKPLLDCLSQAPAADTHLIHVLRMALRDQLKNPDHFGQLAKLDLKDRDRDALAGICLGLPGAASADFLLAHVKGQQKSVPAYVQHIARYGLPEVAGQMAELAQEKFAGQWAVQGEVVRALSAGTAARGGKLDDKVRTWGETVTTKLLQSAQQKDRALGIELASALKTPSAKEPLQRLALDLKTPEKLRKSALSALIAIDAKGSIALLGGLLADPASSAAMRDQAAAILGGINQADAQVELLKGLATAPAKLETTFAMHLARTPQGAEKLLQAVAAGKASPRLLQEQAVLVNLRQAKVNDLDARLKLLTKGLPAADVALQKLLEKRRQVWSSAKIDLGQGVKIFEKHCAICHQIAGKGAKVGPNLDGIGLRSVDRLLEDTLDPNRNVDQAFRSTILTMKNGQIVSGLLLREEGAVLVMADAQGKEVRVAKDQVDEQRHSPLSPMPANFAEQIGEQDFAHLLGYLLNQRPDAKK